MPAGSRPNNAMMFESSVGGSPAFLGSNIYILNYNYSCDQTLDWEIDWGLINAPSLSYAVTIEQSMNGAGYTTINSDATTPYDYSKGIGEQDGTGQSDDFRLRIIRRLDNMIMDERVITQTYQNCTPV